MSRFGADGLRGGSSLWARKRDIERRRQRGLDSVHGRNACKGSGR